MKFLTTDINKTKVVEKAAAGIAGGILRVQDWFSVTMQRFTKDWKQQQRWIFLYGVCIVFGGLSIVVIIHPFQSTGISSIMLPKPVNRITLYNSRIKAF